MDAANKGYDEVRGVVLKLDEARIVMNKLMGPNGALNQDQRIKYLSGDVAANDALMPAGNSPAAIGYGGRNPRGGPISSSIRSGSGL